MTIVEFFGGRITHKYLMNKTKWELACMYMELLAEYEKLKQNQQEVTND